jgi:nitrile hydratase
LGRLPRIRHARVESARGGIQGEEEIKVSEDHDHNTSVRGPAARVKALEELLTEKGLVDPARLDQIIETYQHAVGPRVGARVVAKAWCDANFHRRLMTDAVAACAELGIAGPEGGHLVAVENTSRVHNLVVCTLCSCYPWPVLGLPPAWYKSFAYRSRAVSDPRGVMREFGLVIPDEVEVRVWDSSAEQRYLVVPERPAGTESMSEDELAAIVTRDSMIGVARVTAPARGRSR